MALQESAKVDNDLNATWSLGRVLEHKRCNTCMWFSRDKEHKLRAAFLDVNRVAFR